MVAFSAVANLCLIPEFAGEAMEGGGGRCTGCCENGWGVKNPWGMEGVCGGLGWLGGKKLKSTLVY